MLTINIDLGNLDKNFVINDSHEQSSIEKKSRDTIFIKTYIIIDNDIIVSSSSVWTNNC